MEVKADVELVRTATTYAIRACVMAFRKLEVAGEVSRQMRHTRIRCSWMSLTMQYGIKVSIVSIRTSVISTPQYTHIKYIKYFLKPLQTPKPTPFSIPATKMGPIGNCKSCDYSSSNLDDGLCVSCGSAHNGLASHQKYGGFPRPDGASSNKVA
jgi:hypothetical protein